jgi:hypothetical protein
VWETTFRGGPPVDTLFMTPVDNGCCGRRAEPRVRASTGNPLRSVTGDLHQQALSTASTGAMMTMFRSFEENKSNHLGVEKSARANGGVRYARLEHTP